MRFTCAVHPLAILAVLCMPTALHTAAEQAGSGPTLRKLPGSTGNYSIRDLGTLGDQHSFAVGVNERGQVLGNSGRPFLWDHGVMTDLEALTGRSLVVYTINERGDFAGQIAGGRAFLFRNGDLIELGALRDDNFSTAFLANDCGQVAGWSHTYDVESRRGFLWQNGVMTDLGTLGGTRTEPFDMDDRGQVVGMSYTQDEVPHAFLWENGTMTDLGALQGDLVSFATAVNNAGQVVGWSAVDAATGTPRHAFLWQDGVMTPLGTTGGATSQPHDINERSQVIGSSQTASGELHGFLWEHGSMVDIGTLGGTFSVATAINEHGQVACQSITADGMRHACLFENGVMTDLGTLGGRTSLAYMINDAGIVGGRAYLADGSYHAAVWERGPGRLPR